VRKMQRRRRTILDEFDGMERLVDDLFENVFSLEPMWDIQTRALKPLCEIKETRESVLVLVDLPNVQKDAIELRAEEKSIDVSAELLRPVRYERWGSAQRECEFKKLSATIPLPVEVDPDGAVAAFREGILSVELPKKIKKRTVKIG
jgi:HSP20 family protein